MCSDDRNTAASRIRRLTPEERADMADVLDAGTSLYDSDVRALIDHATAMDDEVARIEREAQEYIDLLRANGALAEAMGAEGVLAIVRGTFTGGRD